MKHMENISFPLTTKAWPFELSVYKIPIDLKSLAEIFTQF